MRKPLIAGNWKLNKNIEESKELAGKLVEELSGKDLAAEAMIIPTFTSLQMAQAMIKDSAVKLGAQDLCQFESGAYTGEISAEMLKEIGVSSVLVGHSERRQIFNEGDDIINAKLKRALEANLQVILCCGESLETREANKADEWVCKQIESALKDNTVALASELVVAYEPIWAIGTGKTCDASEANRIIKVIRTKLADLLGEDLAKHIRILYGGSVKSSTIEEQMAQSDIDGALVGGASLKADEFSKIIAGASLKAAIQ